MQIEITHTPFVPQNWKGLSLPEQLANIGSEVHRALSWQKRGDDDASQHAWDRSFDLLDATIAIQQGRPGLRELLRLREVCGSFIMGSVFYSSAEELHRYFLSFAIFAAGRR